MHCELLKQMANGFRNRRKDKCNEETDMLILNAQ